MLLYDIICDCLLLHIVCVYHSMTLQGVTQLEYVVEVFCALQLLTHVCISLSIYIYIYVCERERERGTYMYNYTCRYISLSICIYIYIYIYTHTGVDTHMYHMRLSVYYDCYVSACVVCVTRFGLKVVDTGPRLGLNLVDITIYYVYIYIYIYTCFTPPSEIDWGLFLAVVVGLRRDVSISRNWLKG